MTNFFKSFFNLYLVVLTFLVVMPFLAPLFLHIGLEPVAKIIYFFYSFTCHQFDHRSIHLYDNQLAWCARDTGIWLGIWLSAIVTKIYKIKPIKLYWLIPFVIPIALDGGIQTIYTMFDINPVGINAGMPLYISNNLVRFATGSFFGIGLSLWISPTIFQNVATEEVEPKHKKYFYPALVSTLFTSLIIGYVLFVQLWALTSTKYDPVNNLDSVVKTPEKDFFTRRRHAVCATNPLDESNYKNPLDNFVDLDCFFGGE